MSRRDFCFSRDALLAAPGHTHWNPPAPTGRAGTAALFQVADRLELIDLFL